MALSLLLAACGPGPTPTLAPTLTPPPMPTATPIPTPTLPPLAEWVAEGEARLRQSDFAGAEAAYRRALEAEASYHPAHTGLSQVLVWQAGREEEAQAEAQAAVELAPDSAAAHAALARAQVALVRPAEALAAAERAAELESDSAAVQAALALAYRLDRQVDAARQAAERAVALGPDLADAYQALAVAYEAAADAPRARAALQRAVDLEPAFAPWHVLLGSQWRLQGDYARADAEFEQAQAQAPDDVNAILGQAYLAVLRADYAAAQGYVDRAIGRIPDAPQGYVAQGFLHLQRQAWADALSAFRRALRTRDDDWDALRGIGYAYVGEGDCEAAERQAEELQALYPGFAEGKMLAGLAELCSGAALGARQPLRQAVGLEPYNPSAHRLLGLAYRAAGRWDEALASLVEALRVSPFGAEVHLDLAALYAAQDEADWAEAEYRVALRLNSASGEAQVGLGKLLLNEGEPGQAQARAEEALLIREDDADALRLLGQALLAQGLVDQAVEVLEELVDQQPEDGLAYLTLGLAYRDLGRYADAQEALETCLDLGPEGVDAQRLRDLAAVLGQGYLLAQEDALSQLAELLDRFIEVAVEVRIEEAEAEGRTLVVALDADPTWDEEEILTNMALAFGGAALFAPRVDPPVNNGLTIQAEQDDQAAYLLHGDLQLAQDLEAGLVSDADVASRLEFSRVTEGEGLAPLEQIQTDVSTTRELQPKADVPFQPLDQAGLRERLENDMDAETRAQMQADQAVLVLLGILEPGVDLAELMTEIYTEQVAGFYDPEEKAFYLVEEERQTALDQMTVAHEYVHALQDQYFGLEAPEDDDTNDDQDQAFDALVEGDATLAMLLYANEQLPVFDLLGALFSAGGMESEVLDTSPAFIQEMQLFPYASGLEFVSALYDRGGWDAVNAAYDDPPLSTEQILHPERYQDGDTPLEVTLPDLAEVLGGDWRELDVDVLGELVLRLALAEYLGPGAASVAAGGWGGDQYLLLQQGEAGPHVLVMRIAWDDRYEADEFWSLFRVYLGHRASFQEAVETLVGEVDERWWAAETVSAWAGQTESVVTVVLGADAEATDAVVQALDGP